MKQSFVAPLALAALLLSACATPPADRIAEQPSTAVAEPTAAAEPTPRPEPASAGCASLSFAPELMNALGSASLPVANSRTLESVGGEINVDCQVLGAPQASDPSLATNLLTVRYRMESIPCVPSSIGTSDSEAPFGSILTAPNGNIDYSMCSGSGAEITVSYFSMVDVPLVPVEEIRVIVQLALAAESELASAASAEVANG
jgi:hypothetical protein